MGPVAPPGGEGGGRRPVPPELRPPGGRPESDRSVNGVPVWLWIALAAFLALGAAVVLILPNLIHGPDDARGQQTPVASSGPAVALPSEEPEARRQAQQRLREYLQLRARLELARAPQWGEAEWRRAADQAVAGDQHLAQRRFAAAAERYDQAWQGLMALEADREPRLTAALEEGWRALEADDAATAQSAFERALAIEPDRAEAQQGLHRARVRDEVLQWMDRGREARQSGDLEAARTAFQQAGQLDPDYAPAREEGQQLTQQLADNAFRRAMSEALAALAANRLGEAGQALEQAAALRPEDPSVGDARRRLAEARRQATLEGLRSEAEARVREEDWRGAQARYRAALSLEPEAAFATRGMVRAGQRLRLHAQLDDYLADTARLHSPETLAGAERLLATLGAAPAGEPRLAEKIATLRARAEEARRPVAVTLRSDGQTEVVIYHVGRLGRFQVHRLELPPGTYTAVGSRPGFRDVRAVFRVKPGAPPPPVELRCEEPV